jgi:acetyl esterase/lipase
MGKPLSGAIGPDRRMFGVAAMASLLGATAAAGQAPRPAAAMPADWSRDWPPAEMIPLWPGQPPGRIAGFVAPALPAGWTGDWPPHFLRRTMMPTLAIFRPARPTGEALLLCPGGAYVFVSALGEGIEVARRFNALGVTVFLLNYRLPGEGWRDRADVPLQDAQRAMRLIRARAAAFGIRADRVGVLGFSAGGHLAATLAVDHGETVYDPVDDADAHSARPDHAGLIYPVIRMDGPHVHARSRDELLGPAPSPEAIARRSPNLRVSPATPPCFIAHAQDDVSVPVENGLEMFAALRAARIGCEGHFFAEGQHAFGIGRAGQPNALWPDLFIGWMRRLAPPSPAGGR